MSREAKPEVTSWLGRMPDGVALWLLGAVFSLLLGAIASAIAVHVRVSLLEEKVDDLRGDLVEVKGALGIPVRREDEGARTAALGR
jgi:hypothetical protein